uniref:Minor capsid protein P11 C-terminal conserved region domain-containing protein n=1 Tax=Megaviridae environmental sample TaxID=1737588 RepID=A0A5J6VL42_9VIRU|nr:MAG: hypothetical protein [Megaviridae environmental sample]
MKSRGSKHLKFDGMVFLFAVLGVALVLGYYSNNKYSMESSEYMSNNLSDMPDHSSQQTTQSQPSAGGLVSNHNNDSLPDNVKAAGGNVFSTAYDNVSGISSGQQVPENCVKRENIDPNSLLPGSSDGSYDLSNLPSASQNPNMLSITGSNLIGGVSQVLRNANLQVRSEPANPRVDVGPWQNTTIEPDLSRISFELGNSCGTGQ